MLAALKDLVVQIATGGTLLLLGLLLPQASAQQNQGELLESDGSPQKYFLEVSGTVLNEKFSGVTMSLQFSGVPMGSVQNYQLIAQGFPDSQTLNAFFWNTEYSTMNISANHISCRIRPGFPANQDIHFFYFSPVLLQTISSHRESTDQRQALKTAKPIKVFARAGELDLIISKNKVSGTVWLKGYDAVEHSYVNYSATFTGQLALHIEQKLQRKK